MAELTSAAPSGGATALALTGERTLPGIEHENYWFRRHEAAYRALLPFVHGARLLEAGCGEGYGAAALRERARSVLAVDADVQAAAHAARTYPSIDVVRGDLQRLPLADGAMEVVTNLQVIEHLWDQESFLAECARVLRPAGTLLITTPNRITFSPGRDTPLNPFHTRELSAGELAGMLEREFVVTRMMGLGHGPRLRRWERRHGSVTDQQLAGPPETWSPLLRGFVASVTADDFVVSAVDVDVSLDLVAVAYRRP
ncbi:MAG TPA: class I SAM-dependent methyltransferase [Frankiaceae bacterium]|nr:class I SAM-dependent methyltransferase [Frankiaceae bacterium]